jgi:hypothetical protein
MPSIKSKYGAPTALTATGLGTLADGSSVLSANLDRTALSAVDVALAASFTTGSAAVAGTVIRLFAKFSLDGTTYSSDENDIPIGTVTLRVAGAQTLFKIFSIGSAFSGRISPANLKIRVQQSTGAALTAGGLSYQSIFGQSGIIYDAFGGINVPMLAAVGTGTFVGDNYLSVASLGILPNTGADLQTSLQSAFNAGRDQGRRVYMPAGTYNHSAPLTLNSVVVFGDGAGQTIIHGTNNRNCALNMTGTAPGISLMTVQSTGKASPRPSDRLGNGIYVNNATNYVIKNVHVRNVGECGIMTEFGTGGKILHNKIELTTADGCYNTENTNNLEVAYNQTITTGDDAISFTSYSTGAAVHDVIVHHNSVIGNFESRGITVNGGTNIQIYDNHVDGGTAGISVGSASAWGAIACTNITVSNNTIRDATFTGLGTIGGGAIHLYNDMPPSNTGVVFTNNDVYQPANHGIYVWGSTQISASITNNNFYMTADHQVYVNGNAGATLITQTNNVRFAPTSYPGDKIPANVGGLEA